MAEKATTNTEEGAMELTGGTATFHGWKYSHYFLVVEENEKNLRAKCTLCGPSKKPLSTAHNTTSNFKKHLQTVHKTTTLVEKDPCKTVARSREGICRMLVNQVNKNDSAQLQTKALFQQQKSMV